MITRIRELEIRLDTVAKLLLYFDNRNDVLKSSIIDNLNQLISHYHCRLKKVAKIGEKQALIKFVNYTPNAPDSINLIYSTL